MKILMVLTSHNEFGTSGNATGFWLEEFATPYYLFIDKGAVVTLASPKGGTPPIDPTSEQEAYATDATRRFAEDDTVRKLLADTCILEKLDAEEFDAVFYPGGHGPLWDLANNEKSLSLISDFLAQGKPVGAVCHGSAALLQVKNSDGDFVIKGKEFSAFTDSEEEIVGATALVPFSIEQEAIENGAIFRKSGDWSSFAVADGLLITGQNPQSSEATAQLFLEKLVS